MLWLFFIIIVISIIIITITIIIIIIIITIIIIVIIIIIIIIIINIIIIVITLIRGNVACPPLFARLLRSDLIDQACGHGEQRCIANATTRFRDWLARDAE